MRISYCSSGVCSSNLSAAASSLKASRRFAAFVCLLLARSAGPQILAVASRRWCRIIPAGVALLLDRRGRAEYLLVWRSNPAPLARLVANEPIILTVILTQQSMQCQRHLSVSDVIQPGHLSNQIVLFAGASADRRNTSMTISLYDLSVN